MTDLALDYVSPLPPTRTGIADYSVDLLPHLEALCRLRVVRLPGQEVSPEVAARWEPVSHECLGDPGRLPLYHMGNNHHHLEVERLAMRHPGVMTLHDLVLHHFLLGKTIGKGDWHEYRRRLGLEHGWIGEVASRAGRWGAWGDSLQFALPANGRLVRRQRGVLVHSEWARTMLLEETPDLAVRTVPMGIPLPARIGNERAQAFRESLGIGSGTPLLGTFGFQTPMKRPGVAVEALAKPELKRAHLVVAGEIARTLDLERLVEAAGVSDRVHVTGFLDYAAFEAAIAACDLCLNLRYPSAGETSAALLRTLALGRPTVISEYAQFAELPDEVAMRVQMGDGEVDALAEAVARLLDDRDRLVAMGEAAREYVRTEHDPAASASAVVEACKGLATGGSSSAGVPTVAPTTLTWSRLAGAVDVEGHEPPWPEGERRRLSIRLENRGTARWLAGTAGPGGVTLRLVLLAGGRDWLSDRPWSPLQEDLAPGASARIVAEVRRPLGPARLRVEPHVLGNSGFRVLGGPTWESEI